MLCVVEQPFDVVTIERTREFRGYYHVLGGAISFLNPEPLAPFVDLVCAGEGEACGCEQVTPCDQVRRRISGEGSP